jgi:Lrp/AsnC family transcriptional regulator for asnA, asnC and gidA
MYELDEKDKEILAVLKENSQLSIQAISKRTAIPIATVHHRIVKLRENGVIKAYTIVINPEVLGRKMVAFVMIKATQKADQAALLYQISKHDLVQEGSMLTGEFDLIFKVRVKDMDELNGFVVKYLRTIDEVAETRTMLSYENVEK